MKQYRLLITSFVLLLLLSFSVDAQTKKKPVKKTVQKTQPQKKQAPQKKPVTKTIPPVVRTVNATEDEKRVRDIVAFLQYLLNTLGSSSTSTRDKEVLVKESYSKIFRDAKVQIEDDLDEERVVVTNKDIVPYLKDVDFFFKDVKFEFTIEDIKSSTLKSGELFYKVSTRRVLSGTTTDGEVITNTIPRYIEVNYQPDVQDLKIVSIYTNEFNEKEVLTNWWSDLSIEWQTILRKKLPGNNTADSLQISEIKTITYTEELDLSNNAMIQDIEPLSRLLNLKSLSLYNTNVKDLTPIRNLTELELLEIATTKISDLSPLKYANKLVSLDIRNTMVTDISIVEKMPLLQNLYIRETPVRDFSNIALLTELKNADLANTKISDLTPFENLVNITVLNLSGTSIQDLNPLKNLKKLLTLDIDSTRISNIQALSNLESLTVLHANYTSVANLMALQKLSHLEKVYADHSGINREAANSFIAVQPKVQVIFDSDNLQSWWNALSPEWQDVLSKAAKVGLTPSKEEMANLSHLDSINMGGSIRLNTLEPLRKLQKLRVLIASRSGISDLSPLQDHKEIKYLDISETEVSDISILSQFTKLKIVKADKSKIENMERLSLTGLERFYADNTMVHDISAREFLEKNPKCLLIFKTVHLNRWWNSLNNNWKDVFRLQMGKDTTSTRENLHKLTEQEALHFKDAPVSDLNGLSEFVHLKELHFSGTAITTIPPLENIKSLTSLHATSSPIQQIESLSLITTLEDLDISNTPIEDLKVVGNLSQLKKLNCSGTQIKRLDALEKLEHLESLDCSNTNASKLDPLDNLQLKTLKCYNTKISSRTIESFKAKHPDCNVIYYR
ncbi:MAG: leucine-rich repeat domain-containing protein [Chryseolinea sp.]